jgi:hypothetical protein
MEMFFIYIFHTTPSPPAEVLLDKETFEHLISAVAFTSDVKHLYLDIPGGKLAFRPLREDTV